MKSFFKFHGVLLALASLSVWSAAAETRALAGRVIDQTGAALPGTNVFVRRLKTGLEIAAIADSQGSFRIEVRPGEYRVTAARADFATKWQIVDVPSPEAQDLRITLPPAPLVQQVVVSGSREEELVENSVTKVDVISRTAIKDSGYERVSDLLAEEPDVATHAFVQVSGSVYGPQRRARGISASDSSSRTRSTWRETPTLLKTCFLCQRTVSSSRPVARAMSRMVRPSASCRNCIPIVCCCGVETRA